MTKVLTEEEVASITEITSDTELDSSAGRQQILDLCVSHEKLRDQVLHFSNAVDTLRELRKLDEKKIGTLTARIREEGHHSP